MKASVGVRRALLAQIADGQFQVGAELPSESQLAERLGVSRLTVRESTRSLADAGVFEVQQGRRHRVADPAGWSVLDPDVVAVRAQLADDLSAIVADLMDARLVLETGIAGLAAERITAEQLAALEGAVDVMRDELDGDVERSARADIRFHEILVDAAGNAFLTGAFTPLQQMLLTVRLRTSASRSVRVDAIAWHARILEALRRGDTQAAAGAMRGHMQQTLEATRGMGVQSLMGSDS